MQVWRGHQAFSRYSQLRIALAVLTEAVPRMRAWCDARKHERQQKAMAAAATVIQAIVRGRAARQLLSRQHRAVTQIAARYRGWKTRRSSHVKVC
jgi:IQ calmodulin-binding motif